MAQSSPKSAHPHQPDESYNDARFIEPHVAQMLFFRKEESFQETMNSIRGELSPLSRGFSRFIHSGPVELASDIVSRALGRPIALLIGGLISFFGLLPLYLIAQRVGFEMRGSEFYALFLLGWLIGIVVDLIRIPLGQTKADL